MIELLLCPFCGSDKVGVFEVANNIWDVSCKNCPAIMCDFTSKEVAITAWNTRRRKNESGCCCEFDEDGETVVKACMAHSLWRDNG